MFSSHENKNSSEYDEQELMRKFLLKFINFFHANHPKDQNIQLFLNEINDQSTPPPMSGFHPIFLPSSSSSFSSEGQGQAVEAQGQSYENILSNLLFWLWDMTRNGYKGKISLIVITNSLSVIRLMNQFKSRG